MRVAPVGAQPRTPSGRGYLLPGCWGYRMALTSLITSSFVFTSGRMMPNAPSSTNSLSTSRALLPDQDVQLAREHQRRGRLRRIDTEGQHLAPVRGLSLPSRL